VGRTRKEREDWDDGIRSWRRRRRRIREGLALV